MDIDERQYVWQPGGVEMLPLADVSACCAPVTSSPLGEVEPAMDAAFRRAIQRLRLLPFRTRERSWNKDWRLSRKTHERLQFSLRWTPVWGAKNWPFKKGNTPSI